MGRTEITKFFILFLLISVPASAFEFSFSCSEKFTSYYYGGEHIYSSCSLKPKTDSDAKQMDGLTYLALSELDSAAIQVEVKMKNGRTFLFPTPNDEYSAKEETSLKFYVPEFGGVDEIIIRVQGYVPIIDKRLLNLSVLSFSEEKKLFDLNLTAVNKQKFYEDIKRFEKENCTDSKQLLKAKSIFNEDKYIEAEAILAEIEEEVKECIFKEQTKEYEKRLEEIEGRYNDVKKKYLLLEVKVEKDKEQIENLAEITLRLENISAKLKEVEKNISKAKELIRQAKFDSATNLTNSIETQLKEIETGIKETDALISKKLDLMLIAGIFGLIAVVSFFAIVAIYRIRNKDKW
ncbi:MAG: hypothetical protein QFX40_05520 [Archaeoglobales archaeon]|nr:hypothetical protein [Archaeoglobales archaeon]